jgi:pimeloyl-ACP methyl ester carboxylesterase
MTRPVLDRKPLQPSTIEWAGAGPATLLLAHATGFNKLVWRPTVDALRREGFGGRIVAFDFRSHGTSPKSDDHAWSHFAEDVTETLSAIEGPVVGVGHSMGGAALLRSALDHPGRFVGQVLVEPIIFPPFSFDGDDHPLVLGAARRRREFGAPGEALANFAAKAVFAKWDPDALAAYIEGGLVPEGERWVLACEPADEAATFRASGSDGVFDRLAEVPIPVWLVVGADTDTYPPGYVDVLLDRMAGSRLVTVPEAGHFVPMEQPVALARVIVEATSRFLSD